MLLAELTVGEKATVVALRLVGHEKRRLQDLGLLPGATVETVMRSPLGEPTAYRIRGATIALRAAQTRAIEVEACR